MTTVLVFGTFDLFHPGHAFFLQEAKKHGDVLKIVVARDETVVKVKGRPPVHSEEQRRQKLQSLPYVDEACLGSLGDKHDVIRQIKPDVICLGHDQTHFTEKLEETLHALGLECTIVRIPAFERDTYSSSKLRKDLFSGRTAHHHS